MFIFLKPHFEIKPWAGKELNKLYDCPVSAGEAWIASGYKNKSSIVSKGIYKDKTLRWLWNNHQELFGNQEEKEFPLLLKLISSKQDLSVQVHPNDEYALKNHNQLGKFECWYIMPETKAKTVTLGVDAKNSKQLRDIIDKGMLQDYLVKKEIKPSDLVVVEPGRVHAIHGNSFILEVQESSNITYRLFDHNRIPKRELHIEDSLNVIDYNNDKNFVFEFKNDESYNNKFFNMYKLQGDSLIKKKSYLIIHALSGEGTINDTNVKKGDTFIVTFKEEELKVNGNLELMVVEPKLEKKGRKQMRKAALITGIIGQDGYYLTELLLNKDYEVHGLIQSKADLYNSALNKFVNNPNFFTHIGDLTDTSSINRIIERVKPDEIYHLASQSHVDLSFDIPEYTAQVNALGTLRLLDAIKSSEMRTKMFNLSSQYLFSGDIYPQNEETKFEPKSPYAISKLYAFNIASNYRETFNMFVTNGICFNHESPLRDTTFVAKKIIEGAKVSIKDKNFILELGNLNAKREWGHAKDYARAMWLSLQQPQSNDYVIATGEPCTVREFAIKAYKKLGIDLVFEGEGLNEVGIDSNTKRILVKVDSKLLRLSDGKELTGDSTKFKKDTKFRFQYTIDSLIDEMMEE